MNGDVINVYYNVVTIQEQLMGIVPDIKAMLEGSLNLQFILHIPITVCVCSDYQTLSDYALIVLLSLVSLLCSGGAILSDKTHHACYLQGAESPSRETVRCTASQEFTSML
jgi:hypothetical protein